MLSVPSGRQRSAQDINTGIELSIIFNLWMHCKHVSTPKEGPRTAKLGSRSASWWMGKSGAALLLDPSPRWFNFFVNSDEIVGSVSMMMMLRLFIFLVTRNELRDTSPNGVIGLTCSIGFIGPISLICFNQLNQSNQLNQWNHFFTLPVRGIGRGSVQQAQKASWDIRW